MDKELTETLKKVIGPNIRKARQRLGLSQARLAEMVEMSTEVLGRMERKQVLPRLERLVLLCRILGTSPDQMLGFTSGAAGAQAAAPTSPAYDEMMTVMRHFFLQMEARLTEQERKELMQTFSHLQRLITLMKKKKEPAGGAQPRRTRKRGRKQKGSA